MGRTSQELLTAAKTGDGDAVARCLLLGADLECVDSDSRTPLHFASRFGKADIVERLLNASASVYARNSHQSTPLALAAAHGHVRVVEMLLKAGAEVNAVDKDGDTPLMAAAILNDRDAVVRVLVAAGADVNGANNGGRTALIGAALKPDRRPDLHVALLRTLVDAGANVNAAKANDNTALFFAAVNGHVEAVELLLDVGADVNHANSFGDTAPHVAAGKGYDVLVTRLLEAGADYSAVNKASKTALDVAADGGQSDVVQLLTTAASSSHAFLAAVKRNDLTVVRKLLDRHASVRGLHARTPLHTAAQYGALDVLKLLVFRGASVQDRDDAGWTALHFASHNGHALVVRMLLAQGSLPNVKDEHGRLPIDLAARHGHLDVVRKLHIEPASLTNVSFDGPFRRNRLIDAVDANGWTVLHHAVRYGDAASVACLLQHGAATARQTTSPTTPKTPLLIAARLGDLDKLARLLAHKDIDLESRDFYGTALLVAVAMGHARIAAALLEAGADVNAQDARGHTALLVATLRGDTDAVQLLLQHGAKTDIASDAGKTPLDHAATTNEQLQSVLQFYHSSQQFHDRSLTMLSDPSTITMDAVQALVPMITSVHDLRLVLSLVSVGSPPDASALVKAAFRHVVAAKLVLDDAACVFFKMALEHCEKSQLLAHNEFLLLDRQAEKANTESADWVFDLRAHVYANSTRINTHEQCLAAVVHGLHDIHAVVQENRAVIKTVATRVGSLQEQVAAGRRIVAQLVEHTNAQSDQIQRVHQRLIDSERAVVSVTRRCNVFESALVAKQEQEGTRSASEEGQADLGHHRVHCRVGYARREGLRGHDHRVRQLDRDRQPPVWRVGHCGIAEAVQTELLPAVEQQFLKLAIPEAEFETLLREEIALQHPEIHQECEQRQLVVALDGGRGDAAREIMPSLDAEEATLRSVLDQLRLLAEGLQTERIEPPAAPVVTSRDNQASHTTWQPPASVEPCAPSETKPPSASAIGDKGTVVSLDDLEAFPFHAAVHASGGSLEVFTNRVRDLGVSNNATAVATRAMAMAIPLDTNQATTETARVFLCAAEYAYCRGYRDVGDFLASKMPDASIVAEFDGVLSVELAESSDDFPYVAIVDDCHDDVDECEVEFELLVDEGHDLDARIEADVERPVATTAVAWSAVEYASFLGYVDIVKLLVKEHCKALPAKTRVQLLKTARERAASGA